MTCYDLGWVSLATYVVGLAIGAGMVFAAAMRRTR